MYTSFHVLIYETVPWKTREMGFSWEGKYTLKPSKRFAPFCVRLFFPLDITSILGTIFKYMCGYHRGEFQFWSEI